jgi:hypothetical protein
MRHPDDQASLHELEVEIIGRSGPEYGLRITSPDGATAHGTFRFPLSGEEIQAVRTASSDVQPIRRSLAPQPADFAKAIGARLFDSLFAGRPGRLYTQTTLASRRLGLRLVCDDPLVMALPWELLYDHEILNDFIALSSYTLARKISGPESPQDKPVAAPFKVLLVAANTLYDSSLPYAQEEVAQLRALLELSAQVTLFTSAQTTLSDLAQALAKYQPHVLHYIGHGEIGVTGEQLLHLSDVAGGKISYLSSSSFADLLGQAPDLRLTFLNANNTDMFAAAAAHTVPAVIGMRGLITDQASMIFATNFYRRVVDGYPLEEAASNARKRLNYENPGSVEWAVPVLYLRNGGTLLPSSMDPAAVAAARPGSADVSLDDVTSGVVAADPNRQDELEYLTKKLAVTKANLDELKLKKEEMGEAVPSLVTSQIEKLEQELSQTSRQISELER